MLLQDLYLPRMTPNVLDSDVLDTWSDITREYMRMRR